MNRSKRLYRMSLIGLASAAIGLSALLTTPAAIANVHNYHVMALKAPTDITSVFISGRGYTEWRSGTVDKEETLGNVGDIDNPTAMDVCYTFTIPKGDDIEINNTGGWHSSIDQKIYSYVNQGEGRQGPGLGTQYSHPKWLNGTELRISTYTSPDCTIGQVKQALQSVPGDGTGILNVDLTT